jgi:hypothetical protein
VLLSATAETLTIANRSARPAAVVSIAVHSIRSLSVWTGRSSTWRQGGKIGAFAGFTAASALYAARHRRCVGWECGRSSEWIGWGGVGAMAGAALGGLIGALITSDVWHEVPVSRIQPHVAWVAGGFAAGLSGSF